MCCYRDLYLCAALCEYIIVRGGVVDNYWSLDVGQFELPSTALPGEVHVVQIGQHLREWSLSTTLPK